MALQTKANLKAFFETGDTPTESNFIDLIDSTVLQTTDQNTTLLNVINEVGSGDDVTINSAVTVIASGAVGINKAVPTANKLHIDNSTSTTVAAQIDLNSDAAVNGLTIANSSVGSSAGAIFRLSTAGTGDCSIQFADGDDSWAAGMTGSGGKFVITDGALSASSTAEFVAQSGKVGIGGDVNTQADLTLNGTLGFLISKAASDPVGTTTDGVVYFNTTSKKLKVYANSGWQTVTSA